MRLKKCNSYLLTISFKYALLASISLVAIFSEYNLNIRNEYSILNLDFGSESDSLDLLEDIEEQVLEMFYVDLDNVSLPLFYSKDHRSKADFNFPSGYSEIQALPPEVNLI
jgi:hypothetical protein